MREHHCERVERAGHIPDLEARLYFALVALILLVAAWLLLGLVFAQRLPEGA